MKFKEVLKFEKENMPDFQWRLEKFLFAFLAVCLGGGILMICACLAISLLSGEDGGLWYIPLIVWVCAVVGMTVPLVIKSKKVKAKLWRYHTDNLLKEFYDTDYAEARQKMLDDGKINEDGFIIPVGDGKNEIFPFDEVRIIFNPQFWGGKLFLQVVLVGKNDLTYVDGMDNTYYNFLIRHTGLIMNKNTFELFDKDKERFVKALLKNNDALRVERQLQMI